MSERLAVLENTVRQQCLRLSHQQKALNDMKASNIRKDLDIQHNEDVLDDLAATVEHLEEIIDVIQVPAGGKRLITSLKVMKETYF